MSMLMIVEEEKKKNVVIVSCGSFNPVHHAHLMMFELARDHLNGTGKYNVLAGIISPCSDGYVKKDLIESKHRIEMIRLALEGKNDWVQLETWEADKPIFTRTALVLRYYDKQVKSTYGPETSLVFLCGSDLLESFCKPNVWIQEHIEEIIDKYGLVVHNRGGLDLCKLIHETDFLSKRKNKIHIVDDLFKNEISSSLVRLAIAHGKSIKYAVDDQVIEYIQANNLYQESLRYLHN